MQDTAGRENKERRRIPIPIKRASEKERKKDETSGETMTEFFRIQERTNSLD